MRKNTPSRKSNFGTLSKEEIREMFSDPIWAEKFPPILNLEQAAELAHVSKDTIYDWRSRGRLRGCSSHVGKHIRINRDRFVAFLMDSPS